jgi:glutaredoxin
MSIAMFIRRRSLTASRPVRVVLSLAIVFVLLCGTSCDDARRHLEEAKQTLSALGSETSTADDEAAKSKSQGTSLGAGHAKRLYYQFIDEAGAVRFVERITDVPPEWRKRVGFVEMDSPPPLSPMMAKNTRDRRFEEVADKYRNVMPNKAAAQVVLYSANWCGWCRKARRHLDGRGIDYEIRDIDHPQNLAELVAKTGQKGIPVLDVGGRVVTGFSPDRYDALIRDARS